MNFTLQSFIQHMNLQTDDFILLTGDLKRFLRKAKKENINFNLNDFLEIINKKLGEQGTLAIQTFNWDFCNYQPYDINKSISKTGILGNYALKNKNFKRTQHPIYSFAVSGKYQQELAELENKGAFDANSPFQFMHKHHAKMIIIDLPLQKSFTFVHYVEESQQVAYRYNKSFESQYTDFQGKTSIKKYDMYVRDIENHIVTDISALEEIFLANNVMQLKNIDTIPIRIIDLDKAFTIIKNDIDHNDGKNLYKRKF